MKRKFYIKEVADIIGVTRDTLRIYEEEGLIYPERDDNGFRIYTEEDIYKLIAIRFHKANDLSLKDIKNILNHTETRDIMDVINQQMRQEESLIALHQSNLKRLKLASYYYRDQSIKMPEESHMDGAYIVSLEYQDFMDTVKAFFRQAKIDSDYVMSFLNVEYDINKSMDAYQSSYLLLDEAEIDALNRDDIKKTCRRLPAAECIKYLVYAEEPIPDRSHLEKIISYADEHGIELTGRVYAHFLYQYETKDGTIFLIELLAEKK